MRDGSRQAQGGPARTSLQGRGRAHFKRRCIVGFMLVVGKAHRLLIS
jgi:hypothetical protein